MSRKNMSQKKRKGPASRGRKTSPVDVTRRTILKWGAITSLVTFIANVTGYNVRTFLQDIKNETRPEAILNKLAEAAQPLVEEVKRTNAGVFISKRTISAVLKAIDLAQHSIKILGINALGPLHQGLEKFEAVLRNGGHVSVGIMDPLGTEFARRENEECEVSDQVTSARLSCEWIASFGILRELYLKRSEHGRGTLDVWIHQEYPPGSLVIVDDSLVQYNPYSTEAACSAAQRANVPRGLTRPLEIYSKETAPDKVSILCNFFEQLRKRGKPLDLTNFGVPTEVLGRVIKSCET